MDVMTEPPRRPDPVQPADAEARALAHTLLDLGHAALAWTDPDTGTPGISRIAFARDPEVGMLTLISGLAPHFRALRDRPDCALMLGEVGDKGDPLTHPRLMIRARAAFVAPDDLARPLIRARWLDRSPKASSYIDLPDFAFVRLTPISALLNGGFARAFRLSPEDLQKRAAL
jgi:putative heme iron utilization protein